MGLMGLSLIMAFKWCPVLWLPVFCAYQEVTLKELRILNNSVCFFLPVLKAWQLVLSL